VNGIPVASPLTNRTEQVTLFAEIDVAQLIEGYKFRHDVDVARLFSGIDKLVLWRDNETGLSFFQPMVVGDAAFYDAVAKGQEYYLQNRFEFMVARHHVSVGAKVCEIGAGAGMFRLHIPNTDYTGLEFGAAARRSAAEQGILVLDRDVEDFANEHPGAFDVTCAFQVVEHVADPMAFITAMAKLTKPGGQIMLSAPTGEGYVARNRDVLNVPPHHVTWWEDSTWLWLKAHFGFSRLDLYHAPASDFPMEWARMIASDGLAGLLGLELRAVVDETPLRRKIDALAEQTAAVIVSGMRNRRDFPAIGHTTLAVFAR